MEKKINIAELLKDCPKGMELDCTMYDYVTLHSVSIYGDYPIKIKTPNEEMVLTKYGQYFDDNFSKCIIFPKGKTNWEGFVPPCKFKDGDIIFTDTGSYTWVSIFKQFSSIICYTYIDLCITDNQLTIDTQGLCNIKDINTQRIATEKEKQKLFATIKANGYKWNDEAKTLNKLTIPKFKVGDKIVQKNSACTTILITNVGDEFYYSNTESSVEALPISEQDNWELAPNKFDITTLVPFESRVLVRDYNSHEWVGDIFTRYNQHSKECSFITLGGQGWRQCIPYNDSTIHLLGTTDDCDEYYKTWTN